MDWEWGSADLSWPRNSSEGHSFVRGSLRLQKRFCLCLTQVWRLMGHGLIHSFKHEHAKQSIFRNLGAGVMQIELVPGNRLFSCGADGTLKTRVLPNAFNIPSRVLDIL